MYCTACNVDSGPTLFCHVCDRYLPTAETGLKAGLVTRAFAVLIDNVVSFTIFFISIRWFLEAGSASTGSQLIVVLVCSAALIIYIIAFFVSLSLGMTPGKWFLGIRAVDKRNGNPPGIGRMFVREIIGKFISGLFFGLGFFWAIWDRDAQAWHDKIAGTVVVQYEGSSAENRPSNAWPVAACVAFFAVIGLQVFTFLNPAWSDHKEADSSAHIIDAPPQPLRYRNATPPTPEVPPIQDTSIQGISPQPGLAQDTSETDVQGTKLEILSTLRQWASAAAANDPQAQSNFYAETVDRYFLARNINREEVFKDESADFAKSGFLSYEIGGLRFDDITQETALVSLTKQYTLANPGLADASKIVHSRLWLRKGNGVWQITGEQDLLH